MSFEELLASAGQENVKPFQYKIPEVGDKVVLLDGAYETLSDGKECAKLARLPHCTIEQASPISIGRNGNYRFLYEIYIEESEYMVGLYGNAWKYLNEEDNKKIR